MGCLSTRYNHLLRFTHFSITRITIIEKDAILASFFLFDYNYLDMKNKIIQIVLFFIISLLITPLLITFSQASKTVDFLNQKKEYLINQPQALMAATVISQSQGDLDAYVVNTTLINETYTTQSISMRLEVFAMTGFNENRRIDKIGFYLTDVVIDDNLAVKDTQGNLSIFMNLTLNQPIGSSPELTYRIPFVSVFDVETYLIFFEYSQWQRSLETPLLIESLSVAYEVENGLLNSTLFIPDSTFETITHLDYQPSIVYENNYLLNEQVFYDADLMDQFQSFWYYDIYFLGGEILILIALFWLIFIFPTQKKNKNSNHSTT